LALGDISTKLKAIEPMMHPTSTMPINLNPLNGTQDLQFVLLLPK